MPAPARSELRSAAAAVLLTLLVGAAAGAGISCDVCGEPIHGRYVEERGRSYHESCYRDSVAPRCAACGRPILESWIRHAEGDYHPDCYRESFQPRCAHCGKPIEGRYLMEGGRNYHPACHRTRTPRCVICDEPLSGKFFADGWGNPYHDRHGREVVCPFCNRVMSEATTGGSFISTANGMRICRLCAQRAVSRRESAGEILERVRARLEGIFPVPEGSFNWRLVDRPRLMALLPGRVIAGNELGITIGDRIRRRGIWVRRIEVSFLSGIPDWLFEGVAAHELAHVWQQLYDLDRLTPEQAEGTAEFAAYLALQDGGTEEGRMKIAAMRESDDPVYGVGFRKALRLAERGGAGAVRVREVLERGRGWPAAP
jgi:hypothetical protein